MTYHIAINCTDGMRMFHGSAQTIADAEYQIWRWMRKNKKSATYWSSHQACVDHEVWFRNARKVAA